MIKQIKKIFTLLVSILFVGSSTFANPTYSGEVASIIYKNCTSCHREGGIAPFKLESYKDAYQMRYAIAASVEDKKMPPWPPDVKYSRLAHERVLSDNDIKTVTDWVNNGGLRGDTATEPKPPVFSNASTLKNINLVFKHDKYTVNSSSDDYRVFVMPSGLNADRFIDAIEFMPGNREIVHHILFYYDESGKCTGLDKANSEPGYASGGGGVGADVTMLAGWVPGTTPNILPKGLGLKIPKGADLVMQVHYAPGSKGKTDSSTINISFFDSQATVREVSINPALFHTAPVLKNGPLFIPAGQKKTFIEEFTVPLDASIMNVAPHMHNIGTHIKVYMVKPQSTDTVNLIQINDWNFHWQGFYYLPKVIKVPRGSLLRAEATYDNTSNNPNNPSNPPIDVKLGEGTNDEMMLVYFSYMPYKQGDENIIIDSAVFTANSPFITAQKSSKIFSVYPNPIQDNQLSIQSTTNFINNYKKVEITSISGKVIEQIDFNGLDKNINLSHLKNGMYLVKVSVGDHTQIERFIINK